jgi:hypothetical protein
MGEDAEALGGVLEALHGQTAGAGRGGGHGHIVTLRYMNIKITQRP